MAGFVVALGSFLLGAFYLVRSFFVDTPVAGWTTIAVLLSIFNGVVIALLSMLGEYVIRTLNTVSTHQDLPRHRAGLLVTRHLLVIGAQRCGTTYLHTMLDAHPSRSPWPGPRNPEPKVFCSDDATGRGAEWYRETYFAHAGDELLLGEKSTSYIEDPNAPARAAGMLGEIHVLAILRDPVERAISNWRFSTDNGLETRSLETALSENLAGPRAWDPSRTSVSPFAYLERGRYVDYLDPWMSAFPDDLARAVPRGAARRRAPAGRALDGLGVDAGARSARPGPGGEPEPGSSRRC